MSKRVSVDAEKVGGFAAAGIVSMAIMGAKKGSHVGIVYGRCAGTKGTVLGGVLGGLIGAVGGAALGTALSIKNAE